MHVFPVRRLLILGIVFAGLVLGTETGDADNPSAKVYRQQLLGLESQVRALVPRVDSAMANNDAKSLESRIALQEEILATQKLLHRLEETVMESNLDVLKSEARNDKDLLLISQCCMALDFSIQAEDNYISTQDRSFRGIAVDGLKLVDTIKKLMPQVGTRQAETKP